MNISICERSALLITDYRVTAFTTLLTSCSGSPASILELEANVFTDSRELATELYPNSVELFSAPYLMNVLVPIFILSFQTDLLNLFLNVMSLFMPHNSPISSS